MRDPQAVLDVYDPPQSSVDDDAIAYAQRKLAAIPAAKSEGSAIENAASAVMKGVGAIPQIPAYTGNFAAKLEGQAAVNILPAMGYNLTPEQENKIRNIEPFYTGNTLADSATNVIGALTGNNALMQKNPVTGGTGNAVLDTMNYQPKTMLGRIGNSAIQAAVGAPNSLISSATAAAGGAGGQIAQEIAPDNPLIQAVGRASGGGIAKGAKESVMPNPTMPEVATAVKDAKDVLYIDTPTSLASTNRNLAENVAGKADLDKLTTQVNKATAGLIDADGHDSINGKAIQTSFKNLGNQYDDLFSKYPSMSLEGRFDDISSNLKELSEKSPTAAAKISDFIFSSMQGDSISADNLKQLVKYDKNSLSKIARSNTEASIPAQGIMDNLDGILKDQMAPADYAKYNEIDSKWRLATNIADSAAQVGAGGKLDPSAIQSILNKEYGANSSGKVGVLQNYLNTVNPTSKASSPLPGFKQSGNSDRGLNMATEIGAATGHPLAAFVTRVAPYAISKGASKYTNMDWYKNRLLQNAQ